MARKAERVQEEERDVFALIGDIKTKTVWESLNDCGLSFAYPSYVEGSMTIHGSSMEQFLNFSFGDQSVGPLFIGDDDEVSKKAEEVGDNCNFIINILCQLINLVWPKQ